MNKSIRFFLICAFLLVSCTQTLSSNDDSKICNLNLQIFVRQGPNVNRTISGKIELGNNTWGSFRGNLVEESGSSHPVSFYFNGQSINFILDINQGQVFGTGIMESNPDACLGNGGGTLSGPQLGDLGDWRGEWVSEAIPTLPVQPTSNDIFPFSPLLLCLYLPILIFGLFLAIKLLQLFAPYKFLTLFKKPRSKKVSTSNVAIQKNNQVTSAEFGTDGKPLAEYLVTYTAGDKLFDLSFEIEKPSEYLGECGITIAKVLDTKSNQATAIEIWLFETKSAQTRSKILASNFCFSQESLRNELEQKGEVVLIQSGKTITLITKEIRAKAEILELKYNSNSLNFESTFNKVVIKIGVWSNTVA